ncbi:diaminopropionate ammonia-lyase [Pseudomonas sp. MWU16-30317]|uniref:diaminopropionate ammonia-lyase n=1 Tax=Pseudomonas sp. MWU16-30317 TaxID=2878095 RepID=UPI001CF94676|nr:diaminopropionate ammonia-lyase [Pseudomonas sp. MWU16-30317]
MSFHLNSGFSQSLSVRQSATEAFSLGAVESVQNHLTCIDYQQTPLYELNTLAGSLGLGSILLKDEGQRSSLRSFKALGGGHAVVRLVLQEVGNALGHRLGAADVNLPAVRAGAAGLTVTCATDGNHGRSVAAAARVVGCRSVIFVHEGVSQSRADAIKAQGAEVIRVPGNYDDSVAHASRMATDHGWHVVSDTSWPGYEHIPTWVMQGYLVMAKEAVEQSLRLGRSVTHVFLQAGVGGFAAAVSAYLTNALGEAAPRVIVVEPDKAACLYDSARNGHATRIAPQQATVMAMLECYEPSLIAWRILAKQASAFMTIPDEAGLRAMVAMAMPLGNDPVVQGGESGAAGLGGLQTILASAQAKQLLGLNADSVVLLFNTEGATDEALYESLLIKARALP